MLLPFLNLGLGNNTSFRTVFIEISIYLKPNWACALVLNMSIWVFKFLIADFIIMKFDDETELFFSLLRFFEIF